LITEKPDAVTKKEMGEIRGLENIKGTPLVKLRSAVKELGYYRKNLEQARDDGNDERVKIFRAMKEYVENKIIRAEVDTGQVPVSEEEKQHVQEIIRDNVLPKFEKFPA
jgi:nucleoside diphosphate kinase